MVSARGRWSFLLLSSPRSARLPPKLRQAETSAAWSLSAAAAGCIWSVTAQGPQPSCWWLASEGLPRIGPFPRHPHPAVFPEVARFTRVCAYDRPGTPVGEKPSRSDPAPQPANAGGAVADLHALLTDAAEAGPYVLVGHSYGGLIVRLYASTYPEDLSGLVLVDVLTEGLREAETPEQWAIQRKLIEGDVRESLALYPALERNDVDRSLDQVRAAPPLRPLPLVVLSADRPWGPQIPSMIAAGKLPADIPPDFGTSPMPRRNRRRRSSPSSCPTRSTSPIRTAATRSIRNSPNS